MIPEGVRLKISYRETGNMEQQIPSMTLFRRVLLMFVATLPLQGLYLDKHASRSHKNISLLHTSRHREVGHRRLIHVRRGVFATRSSNLVT